MKMPAQDVFLRHTAFQPDSINITQQMHRNDRRTGRCFREILSKHGLLQKIPKLNHLCSIQKNFTKQPVPGQIPELIAKRRTKRMLLTGPIAAEPDKLKSARNLTDFKPIPAATTANQSK